MGVGGVLFKTFPMTMDLVSENVVHLHDLFFCDDDMCVDGMGII